jgi:diguanylate cyclase (GGDEF)-like protein
MWRYLILNSLWFTILFMVHFYGSRRSQIFLLTCIYSAALFLVFGRSIDPFAWFFYVSFSLATYLGASQFKRWAFTRANALDEELAIFSQQLRFEDSVLSEKSEDTRIISNQAEEILHLCDKMKEMSQSLDQFEVFLVFCEALSANFKFDCIKLILFSEDKAVSQEPRDVYQMYYSDFQGVFDRASFLREKQKAKGEIYSFDKRVIEMVATKEKPMNFSEESSPFMAHPVMIDKHLAGVLILLGVRTQDFPIFSILAESFVSEIKRLQLYERVQNLAITDGMTGVAVRRHFMERFEEEIQRSKRLALKLSFLMIDIDHFKRFNDQFGHLVGDVVLKEVAETIKKNIREVDLVGRYGGEEFGVFLSETDESGAFFVAERIRRAISERNFTAYNEDLKVTVSIGCSTFSPALSRIATMMGAADSALYEAKKQGRNRVHLYTIER